MSGNVRPILAKVDCSAWFSARFCVILVLFMFFFVILVHDFPCFSVFVHVFLRDSCSWFPIIYYQFLVNVSHSCSLPYILKEWYLITWALTLDRNWNKMIAKNIGHGSLAYSSVFGIFIETSKIIEDERKDHRCRASRWLSYGFSDALRWHSMIFDDFLFISIWYQVSNGQVSRINWWNGGDRPGSPIHPWRASEHQWKS